MTVNEAVEKLETLIDCFSEYPDWNVLTCDDLEAMETLVEFTKERLKTE